MVLEIVAVHGAQQGSIASRAQGSGFTGRVSVDRLKKQLADLSATYIQARKYTQFFREMIG